MKHFIGKDYSRTQDVKKTAIREFSPKISLSWIFRSGILITVTFFSAFFPAFKDKVVENEVGIFGLHPLIMLVNYSLVHLFNRLKRPFAIPDDIDM